MELKLARVKLSAAELLALHTTPKTIIPAPGPGNAIIVVSAMYLNGNSQFSTPGGTMGLFYDGNLAAADYYASMGGTPYTANNVSLSSAPIYTADIPDNIENRAVIAGSSQANPTGGTTPVTITVVYITVPIGA